MPSAGEVNGNTASAPALTCAGLMVLGMCQAAAAEGREAPDVARDAAIRRGFGYLAGGIGQPLAPQGRDQRGYYYLWSMERVGVGYGVKTICNKDWYAWGSDLLVAGQMADGTWQREYGSMVDTSFALLFLKRVNLVRDLTSGLKETSSLGTVSPAAK